MTRATVVGAEPRARARAGPRGLKPAARSAARLHLELGPTCYRDFIGTNVHNAAMVLAAEVGHRFATGATLANPLGISVTIMTVDGFLVFGRRSDKVACHAGFLHTIGGMLEEPDRRDDGGYDIFGAAARELHEELGTYEEEVREMIVAGLLRDRMLHQPELLFEAASTLTRDNLKSRFDPTMADHQHTGIEFVHDDPEAIIPFIEQAAPVTPIAQAAMLLHGRHNWGVTWYEQTCYVLYGEMPPVLNAER